MKVATIIIILVVLGGIAGAIFLSSGKQSTPTSTPAGTYTPVTTVPPTPSPLPTPSPSGEVQKYYTSKNLMVSFSYPVSDEVKEVGNKIYVYEKASVSGVEGGQYVEVFEKPAGQSIDDAIREKFLAGKPDFCTVKISTQDKSVTGFQKREISYPIVENGSEPWFQRHEECGPYSISNGIAYFIYDPNHPTQYAYLSIGQYAIVILYNDGSFKNWQTTIKFLR